ncbi:hypothetical protein COV18_02335 [Candidatus Woesearchaeota archaeon CG10_big_fil_rev_8_21_14_0_10_37_12]|nr:MAG: hypothetical protein COV18_02335 [Candidatus Woesearchaeota archaeon CG10_big_fil_rev_8_21_14_0_10_37_12]
MRTATGSNTECGSELEFGLHGANASDIIARAGLLGLPDHAGTVVEHEVNKDQLVELNGRTSDGYLATDVRALNSGMSALVTRLRETVESTGGVIYGGASLLENTANTETSWARTTSLSQTCANGFKSIMSQQVIVGFDDELAAIAFFNATRRVHPVLLAMSASSPFVRENGNVRTVGHSRRPMQYQQLLSRFPEAMRTQPHLETVEHYWSIVQGVSDDVLALLDQNLLDANWEELRRGRPDGAYFPFKRFNDSQMYWPTRLRPGHRSDRSLLSVEIRSPDMPATIERMIAMNNFVFGLAYAGERDGFDCIDGVDGDGTYDQLVPVAKQGLDAIYNNNPVRLHLVRLGRVAQSGLQYRGFIAESEQLGRMLTTILSDGTDADLLRERFNEQSSIDDVRAYLVARLRNGENSNR